jgi:hypothetical protein
MILEIQAEVIGNFTISPIMEVKKHPYIINVFQSEDDHKYYISVKKKIIDYIDFLPKFEKNEAEELVISLPSRDFYSDIIQLLQHLESFGAIDVGISKIVWGEPLVRWILEDETEHVSPLKEYKARLEYDSSPRDFSQRWLQETLIYERQMGDLYIPFAFFRDGANLYNQFRYTSSFISFYMMLEYFFCKGSWGIKNDEYERDLCLNIGLKRSLEILPHHSEHYSWFLRELKFRKKEYNEEGLLFIINRSRDELSHASNKEKNRNVFKENEYSSLAFIGMMVCMQVSVKRRLLPFVRESERTSFLSK